MSSSTETPAEVALFKLFAVWQIKNQNTAKYFAASMCGLVAVFTIAHWTRFLYVRYCNRLGSLRSLVQTVVIPLQRLNKPRSIRGLTLHPGRTILALVYLGINAALVFYDRPDKAGLSILAKRFGWMTLCNLCLAVFLGLKNTPLSPLAGKSFDAVNVVHRCCGYTTILLLILHAGTYLPALKESGVLTEIMTQPSQIAAGIAGTSMIIILFTANRFVRRAQYEVFYAIHITAVAMILISVGIHRPDLSQKALIITIVAASMWGADRALRLSRWLYYVGGNYCILTPLADEATKVTMYRRLRAQPGSVAFLWIPAVRPLEAHPFSLASNEPAEFVVKARDGFTRALYRTACKAPGGKFKAAVEGPYGHVPNVHDHDHVILIAGGSGVTFSINMALAWARKQRPTGDRRTLKFIWTVRNKSSLAWFSNEVAELQANPRVTIEINVTGSKGGTSFASEQEKVSTSLDSWLQNPSEEDLIKGAQPSLSTRSSESTLRLLKNGRPDMGSHLRSTTAGLSSRDRVLVAGCGPRGLLDQARQAVNECRSPGAPSIELHLEQFSF